MRAARSWSVPPRLLLGGGTDWDFRSRILAVALTQLEDETGPEGHALADEMDPSTNGWWEPHVVHNEATEARQRYLKDNSKTLEPGDYVVIRDGRVKKPAG